MRANQHAFASKAPVSLPVLLGALAMASVPPARRKSYVEIDENEIGRPHFRSKNPVLRSGDNPMTGQGMDFEILAWALYDYLEVEVNTTLKAEKMFAVANGQQYTPQGGNPFNKTDLHTNVEGQGSSLPNPQRMMVKYLQHDVDPHINIADYKNLEYTTVCYFYVGDQKHLYFEDKLAGIPSGSGITGAAATDTNPAQGWPLQSNFSSQVSGDTDDQGVPDQGTPINQGKKFNIVLDPTLVASGVAFKTLDGGQAGGKGIMLWFRLCGIFWRSA